VTQATLDPRTRPYQPFGAAQALFYCKDEEILLEGPAGTGKTRALLEKLHLCLMKYSGARALVVRKTRSSMTESVLVTFEEKVLPEDDPITLGAGRQHRRAYDYSNGSTMVVGGMDKADRIMSTEWDIIGVFEGTELSEDEHEKLTTRLRNGVMPYQQIIVDCNPGPSWHWLNQRANTGRMTRLLSRHEDNPEVTDSYLDKLRALSGARRERLLEGKWADQEGLVYEDFDQAVHVLDRMPDGWEAWTKYRTIDFGYTNAFVCQWWAEDPDGRLYLYREVYRTKTLVEDHAARIVDLSQGERHRATVADHDAEDRATLDRHGVRTVPAYKAVTAGIQAVQERLKAQADGKPRLFILRDACVDRDPELVESKRPTSTLEELDGYAWPPSREGKEEKEAPVKVNDHGVDAMRYLVAHVDRVGGGPEPGFH
jgi:PBSX family phage terminase large subunit